MGTQAHWFTSRYRYRVVAQDEDDAPRGWTQADTLADIREDLPADAQVEIGRVLPKRRRESSGIDYEPYGVLVDGRVRRST